MIFYLQVIIVSVFALSILLPFLFMPLLWAVLLIFMNTAVVPVLSALLYAPFKKPLFIRPDFIPFVSGCIESAVAILLFVFLSQHYLVPKTFFLFLVLQYTLNQLARVFRELEKFPNYREAKELMGYYGLLVPALSIYLLYKLITL